MPVVAINKQVSLFGLNYPVVTSLPCDGAALFDLTVPPAKGGALTVRTDNLSGSLTLGAGHGVATGNRLDLFWTVAGVNFARRGAVVGTVAGTAVPFGAGLGDNLPVAGTLLTVGVPVIQPLPVAGNNLVALAAAAEAANAQVVFVDGANAELLAVPIRLTNTAYSWTTADGTTNPLAGVTVANVYASHADAGSARRVYGAGAVS